MPRKDFFLEREETRYT